MKFKDYLIIFTLFFVLMCSVGAISAASNDTAEDIASEVVSSSLANDNDPIDLITEESSQLNAENDNASIAEVNDDVLSENVSSTSDKSDLSISSKSNLKIVKYTNFVKKGKTYYFYLTDVNGKAVSNKKLDIELDGKKYVKTTDAKGMVGIAIGSSKSEVSLNVTFKGDKNYNAFSKTLKVYVVKSLSISIGNTKLLTKGYLRIYLSGKKSEISNKYVKITIGGKKFTKKTSPEGFIVFKPKVRAKTYKVKVEYGNYIVTKKIKCISGKVVNPNKKYIKTVNGVPDIDVMPGNFVMADNDGRYTLLKSQYKSTIKRDSYCLFLYGKLSKYTFFKTKDCPKFNHIIKRQKWNVIERALNTRLVKKNKYNYWPKSITVSLEGKSYTYSEVRDIQNTEYTCGPTSASVCSQALRKYYSEKFFQKQAHVTNGVNIPVLKSAISRNGFKTAYYSSVDVAVKQLAKGGVAVIAFLPKHYVSIIDVSRDGKKILVSNSYGKYDVGGDSRVPTDWVSVKYFKSKFAGTGLIVKLNYKLSKNKKNQLKHFCSNMGGKWTRKNVNERIPDVGR